MKTKEKEVWEGSPVYHLGDPDSESVAGRSYIKVHARVPGIPLIATVWVPEEGRQSDAIGIARERATLIEIAPELLDLLLESSVKLDAYHCEGKIVGPDADLFLRIKVVAKKVGRCP